MPPLSDDDKKEVQGLVTSALGLKEGQTLADVIGEHVNGTVNAYDKRRKKEEGQLSETLKQLSEKVESLAAGGGDGDGGDGDGDAGKGGKLSPEVQKQLDAIEKRAKQLEKDLEAERQARAAEVAERKKIEQQQAATAQREAARKSAIAAGADPEAVEEFLDIIEHRQLLRQREDGKGYELQHGTDRYTQDPTWHPLDDGMKQYLQGPGKRFLPAVQGDGGSPPGGRPRQGAGGAVEVSAEDLVAMGSSGIEKAIAAGQLKVPTQ